jgi:Uma2 family endonuclease
MGMVTPLYYTANMVRELPEDGNRYEVVDGELLVTPAPRPWHQVIALRLSRALADYLDHHPVGQVICSPADISWSPLDLVQPDIFVVPVDEARTLDWARMQHLLLVAEVLSPSTARADRFTKRRLYQRSRIPIYWIVNGDQRQVEVWSPEREVPEIETRSLIWMPEASSPFVLPLEELFRPL